MTNLPTISITEIQQMAGAVVASQLFGGIKTKEQAFTLMLLCQAKGLHPIEAMERYHLIQGRPALKAETIIAEFQKAGGVVNWDEYSDERVTGTFSHPQGGSLTNSWDMARAQKAGLAGKDNWKNYSAAMLASRCATEAIRRVYPGCLQGMHSVEEVQEIVEAEFAPTQQRKAPKKVEATLAVVEAEPLDRSAQIEYTKELGTMLRALINPETVANEIKARYELKGKLTEVTDLATRYNILADLNEALSSQKESLEAA